MIDVKKEAGNQVLTWIMIQGFIREHNYILRI